MFPPAGQPDIVRAYQKDAYYKTLLQDLLKEWAELALESRTRSWFLHVIKHISSATYLFSAGALSSRSIGEEYCDILQVTDKGNPISKGTKFLYAIAAGLGPLLLLKIGRIRDPSLDFRIFQMFSYVSFLWNKGIDFIDATEHMRKWFQRFHLALFYLYGSYFEFAKRVFRIRYIHTGKQTEKVSYSFLGILIIAQIGISFSLYSCKMIQSSKIDRKVVELDNASALSSSKKCSLCLSLRDSTTATECGHLFCWKCIASWCTEKSQCPLCRRDIALQNLICLYSYD